ncbi:MAG: ATP-binding cassette domain-containing protein [Acidimicrobiaceae bacterium]|nr:ATP-binding cassette domain-containing protein [Acidimicrobiaceae bacterium]MBO0747343.1 ATP-binding cassette domain-containing protein [Acidimicrobiaceae bacterium]
MSGPVLACENLSKQFGGVLAVNRVTLEVPEAGVFGLCGFNGAGKTTLFNLLAGSLRADAGEVRLFGEDVTGKSAAERARLGMARTWQIVRLVRDRTVLDNVAASCLPARRQPILDTLRKSQMSVARERALAMLERVGIADLQGRQVGGLTLENQRLTELARALGSGPSVLLADEPASGLSREQREMLAGVLRDLGSELALVVVEHDLDMLTRISDHMWAMVEGEIAYSGDVEGFRASMEFARLRGIAEVAS